MKKSYILSFLFILQICYAQSEKPFKVGEEYNLIVESPHPYVGSNLDTPKIVWSDSIHFPEASYLSVHFKHFELNLGDFIVIRDPSRLRVWKYDSIKRSNFWSINIFGETLIIEIHSTNKTGSYGFSIDKIAKGIIPFGNNLSNQQALCGDDDSEDAICYLNEGNKIYTSSRAVARILINGTSACTGWLIGDEGHLITNEHCISNQKDADNIVVEFLAEGNNCDDNCTSWFGCSGVIEATSATLIKSNENLDYALLLLPKNVSDTYGFLQCRESCPILNERIYIPQHPRGWGKRIAVNSSDQSDSEGYTKINYLDRRRCGGTGNDLGYYGDTQGGSSGSLVIGFKDNLVVGLHHCGSCPNRGVPINLIIDDLGNDLPNNSVSRFNTPEIEGLNNLCENKTEVYSLTGVNPGTEIEWAISPDFELDYQNELQIKVRALKPNSNLGRTSKISAQFPCENVLIEKEIEIFPLPEIDVLRYVEDPPQEPICKSWYWDLKNVIDLPIVGQDPNSIEIQKISNNFDFALYGTTMMVRAYRTGPLVFRVRASNSCGPTDWVPMQYFVIECNSSGEERYSLAPNPAGSYFSIEALEKDSRYAQELVSYTLFDGSGQIRMAGTLFPGTEIPLGELPSGIYIVQIQAAKIEESHRLVIE